MSEFIASNQKVYPWHCEHDVYIRGYLQPLDDEAMVLREAEAVKYLLQAKDFKSFVTLLKKTGGIFAIVVKRVNTIWIAVDIARSMPLYYSDDLRVLSDSAEIIRKALGISADATNAFRMAELMAGGSVSGSHTVYKEIRQLCMGQAAEIAKSEIYIEEYYHHLQPIRVCTRAEAIHTLQEVAGITFRRVLKAVGKRPIVLSLSGGYDSRFVACMLKELGAENVSCYTYGVESSFESQQSKKVAEALGYRWTCVTYHNEEIAEEIEGENLKYIDSFSGHDYSVYLQNYWAVKQLKESGWIPDNAVFLTGLCHDMPTGEYVPEKASIPLPITSESVATYIVDSRFPRYHWKAEARKNYEKELLDEIRRILPQISNYQEFVQTVDVLETGYRHSRAFLHMNRVHEFFGYEWLLPCWDRGLLDMWYSLPAEYRVHQNLYEEWITEVLCAKYGVGTKKTINSHGRIPQIVNIMRRCSGPVAWLLFQLHIPLKMKTDINGNALLRQRLYEKIEQKSAVKVSRSGVDLLLTIYCMERRYGRNWWADVKTMLKK